MKSPDAKGRRKAVPSTEAQMHVLSAPYFSTSGLEATVKTA